MSVSVDLEYYAQATEGFSGADLQALVYNAHLEVVHATISAKPGVDSEVVSDRDERDVEYTTFGGIDMQGVTSKAEEAALQGRVSPRGFQIRAVFYANARAAEVDNVESDRDSGRVQGHCIDPKEGMSTLNNIRI